jgi:hypothetical protein
MGWGLPIKVSSQCGRQWVCGGLPVWSQVHWPCFLQALAESMFIWMFTGQHNKCLRVYPKIRGNWPGRSWIFRPLSEHLMGWVYRLWISRDRTREHMDMRRTFLVCKDECSRWSFKRYLSWLDNVYVFKDGLSIIACPQTRRCLRTSFQWFCAPDKYLLIFIDIAVLIRSGKAFTSIRQELWKIWYPVSSIPGDVLLCSTKGGTSGIFAMCDSWRIILSLDKFVEGLVKPYSNFWNTWTFES